MVIKDVYQCIWFFFFQLVLQWFEVLEDWCLCWILLFMMIDCEVDSWGMRDGDIVENVSYQIILFIGV